MINNIYNHLIKNKKKVFFSFLVIAFLSRLIIILLTPSSERFVDLAIYADGGQLIAENINPYDFEDSKDLRQELRLDKFAYNEFTCENQERWDYYSNSNLPLTLLFFGLIETLFPSNLLAYRVSFALMDAFLSAMIFLFIAKFWKMKESKNSFIAMVFLGLFSPFLFFEGLIIPEDKGVQILLMICSLFFAFSKKSKVNYFLTIVFLGASIAYKAIGVFLFPICFLALEKEQVLDFVQLFNKNRIVNFIKFSIFTAIATIIYFIPFIPEVFFMATGRLVKETSITPQHASIWRIFDLLVSDNIWTIFRWLGMFFLLALLGLGFLKKRYGVSILVIGLMVLFINYSLFNGAMNRMNMPIVVAILTLGVFYDVKKMVLFYAAGAVLSVGGTLVINKFFPDIDWHICSAIFVLSFIAIFVNFLYDNYKFPRKTLMA